MLSTACVICEALQAASMRRYHIRPCVARHAIMRDMQRTRVCVARQTSMHSATYEHFAGTSVLLRRKVVLEDYPIPQGCRTGYASAWPALSSAYPACPTLS